MHHHAQEALTDYGNVAIALPVLVVALAWLWQSGLQQVAMVLATNAVCAVFATAALKMVSATSGGAFYGMPWHLTPGAPSGHATVSTVVYGGIGILFALRARGLTRAAGVGLAFTLMLGVDITRVTLGCHSPGDVATGLALGSIFAGLTLLVAARSQPRWPPMRALLLGLVATATLMHLTGLRLDSGSIL